jgi:acyl-CoA synthetase (AMP-forming)/AMP-acid ligase II/thioesterase domain-containing protein/acyl carrier protein
MGTSHHLTLYDLIKAQVELNPEATAISAPGRIPLTYGRLGSFVGETVKILNSMGIGRNDRVAIALPNGSEMAVALIAVSAGATCAPLNPGYRESEFDFFLSDLNTKALIVQSGIDSPARTSARARSILIIELSPLFEDDAGMFSLSSDRASEIIHGGFAQPDDVALVLHTSGTTSRPKIVPLTQANISISAQNIQAALGLTSSDRCLNVMPLFHVHGLIGALFSSMAAGASVFCLPGFDGARFFEWFEESRPTWFTAVPTIHQAILDRAASNHGVIKNYPLRFIRSCSASLPLKILNELESAFIAPVIESYGMTEASHQIASSPLPPRQRKAGSVGLAAGQEVAIVDEAENFMPPGSLGEIVIRGANVTQGYENNPTANESSFIKGWLRTGDQGVLDADGYLFIKGRLKEIINRGGEKIAPGEVDKALLDHPAVKEAITFAVPHRTLGEDIVAAIVLRDKASVGEREIRQFAFARLADYKVPSQVLIVDELPKGPTGKPQRIGLADKLGDKLKAAFVAPRNLVEDILEQIWSEVLGLKQVGIHANFFLLGGDSLLAARVVSEISKAFHRELPPPTIFQAPTIEQLASVLEHKGGSVSLCSLVALRDRGFKPPLFCVPGTLGNAFTDLEYLARHLDPDQPVYGLQDGIQNPSKVEALAAQYINEIRGVQPEGPYFLAGICSGGTIAYEMAQQLLTQGHHVALLAMVEPVSPLVSSWSIPASILGRFVKRFRHHSKNVPRLSYAERKVYLRLRVKLITNRWTLTRYVPRPYPDRIHLFLTSESLKFLHNPRLRWRELALGGAEVLEIPGTHDTITGNNDTIIEEAPMKVLAEKLRICIDKALSNKSRS